MAGIILAAGGYVALRTVDPLGNPARATVIAPDDLSKAEPVVAEAIAFLNEMKIQLDNDLDAISVKDPNQWETLDTAMPDQYQKLSEATQSQVYWRIRKSEGGYKLLGTSPLCPLVVVANPEMLDQRRTSGYATICNYFSVWNDEGKDF